LGYQWADRKMQLIFPIRASIFYHDVEMDGAGATYDEALVNFARNVWKKSKGNG